ncbi:MAG: 2-polyprenylphenol 6-hydroxylase [Sphingomonadales bacterium]
MKAAGHLFRLLGSFRKLAAYDALWALQLFEENVPLLKLGRRLICLGVRPSGEAKDKRPGQRLALAFQAMGPAFIKLGQTLSTRPDIMGKAVALDLAELQDRLPPFSASEAHKALEEEFSTKTEDLFSAFEDQPVAAASIAQVHFAVTKEGEEVAVKILRPGIEELFTRDLKDFYWAAGLLERLAPPARRLKPLEVVKLMEKTVAVELDMRMEAAAASELAENMADEPAYRVPGIYWQLTSKRVLTLERVKGIPIARRDDLLAAGHDPKKLAADIVRLFLTQAIRDGFFHADLHPGNLFVAADGAILPVDFGIMGRLSRADRRFLAEMLWGFQTGDYRRVAELHFEAGFVPADQPLALFAQALRAISEPVKGKPVHEISVGRLLAQLLETTETFAMETQPQLLVLQRAMVMSEGLALQLDAEANMWELSAPVLEKLIRENMGPISDLKEILDRARRLARQIPGLLEQLEVWLATKKDPD